MKNPHTTTPVAQEPTGDAVVGLRRRTVPLHRRLLLRVPAILAGSVLGILALVFLLIDVAVEPRLRALADQSVAQSSTLIGDELRKRVIIAQTLCQALAHTGEILPKDVEEHRRVLPRVIDSIGEDWFIAGGGIWPEPGRFEPGVERRSFFFGRQPDDTLKYFDDYNDPAGPGYHNEEWYVPVRFVEPGSVYWSRSYIDPYSREPMVTCSAPIHRDGEYYGVATIDVKLSGLREIFETTTREMGGYAFAVDREGVFLTYPDDALIRTTRKDPNGTQIDSFLSARELGTKAPAFGLIASILDAMDLEAIASARASRQFDPDTAGRIDEGSYQINATQAELIAGLLVRTGDAPQERRFITDLDLRLGEPCFVSARRMPETGWKIVAVMPESHVLAASRTLQRLLMLSLSGVLVLGLGGTLLVLHRDIIRPITTMTKALGEVSGATLPQLTLPHGRDTEIGLLADTINAYSRSLAEAMDALEKHRGELESKIAERTRELRDINAALETARLDADAANKAKSEFLANMSHEIRTPLTAILGFADVLLEDGSIESAPRERVNAIETIKNAGTHLLTIINDILDLSKIEADMMTVEHIDTPLVGVIREVESLLRPRAASKGVELNTRLTRPVPARVISDPTRLRQILMNLTGNALKFTESGEVSLAVDIGGDDKHPRLVIDVEDTGPGMTPEQAARLFTPFRQADGTVSRKHGGTGLGLTISRRLATLMGGVVELRRTEPGKGSSFRFEIPLEAAPGAELVSSLDAVTIPRATKTAVPAITLRGRILLAEDGPDNQRLITFHLRKAGAHVEIADNGRRALEMIEQADAAGTPYDLLLTDIQMPEMDGHTLSRSLRRRGNQMPIVALTAHAMAEDRAACLAAGCNDYATKPIDKAALLATCRTWIDRRDGTSPLAAAA